jgi:hypothetical protein
VFPSIYLDVVYDRYFIVFYCTENTEAESIGNLLIIYTRDPSPVDDDILRKATPLLARYTDLKAKDIQLLSQEGCDNS